MTKISGLGAWTLIGLLTLPLSPCPGWADIILGEEAETIKPRVNIDEAKMISPSALRKDSPGATVKQGIYSPAIKFGEQAGKLHEIGGRQKAAIETLEAQANAEQKTTKPSSTQLGPAHLVHLKGKEVLRIYSNAFSPNIIAGNEKNAVLEAAVGVTISGGGGEYSPNQVAGDYATIGGGMNNTAGGVFKYLDAPFATVGGGKSNQALRRGAAVAGGVSNRAEGLASAVAGGENNAALGAHANVNGGFRNASFADFATVGGGHTNQAIAKASTVMGGEFNRSKGVGSTIAGGLHNETTGKYATIPGGTLNRAEGDTSFAAGNQAQALHDGAFVWSDSANKSFTSTADNQFLIRASGNVGIDTESPSEKLTVNGNIRVMGKVYASEVLDAAGNPVGGATIDEVAAVLAVELQNLETALAQRDQTIAAQQATIVDLDQRLRAIEALVEEAAR